MNTEAKEHLVVDNHDDVVGKSINMLIQAQERLDHQVERVIGRLNPVLRSNSEVRASSTDSVPSGPTSPLVEALNVAARRLNTSADVLSEMLERCDL